jgi:GNAT superfamily N-acetyltransferase
LALLGQLQLSEEQEPGSRSIASFHLEALNPGNLKALLALRSDVGRPLSEETARWRYLQRGGGEMLLAFAGDRVVGHCDSFLRSYVVAGDQAQVRETAEWYTHPDFRGQGVGRELRASFMSRGEPLITIGGSASTRRILPRIGYRHATDAQYFTLSLTTNALIHRKLQSGKLPGGNLVRKVSSKIGRRLRPRLQEDPPGAAVSVVERSDEQPRSSIEPKGNAFAITLSGWEADWHRGEPASEGRYYWLRLERDGALVGWSCTRLHSFMHLRVAKLVHFEVSDHDEATLAWMISASIREAIRLGAEMATCLCAEGPMARALEGLGFTRERPAPVFVYDPQDRKLAGDWRLSYLCGDHSLIRTMF